MASRFTQKAQAVLNLALQSAAELGHTYIGSEHLLLGLLKEGTGVAYQYLNEYHVDLEQVRLRVVELSGIGSPSSLSGADMTPRTKNIIEDSLYEAQHAGQDYIGTEHLLISLLNERDCVAVRILEGMEIPVSESEPRY